MRVGEHCAEITIANVSATGLLARADSPPTVGTQVEILRRGTRIAGEVVWTAGRRFGVRAHEEIDLAALLGESGIGANLSQAESRPSAQTGWWHWRRK